MTRQKYIEEICHTKTKKYPFATHKFGINTMVISIHSCLNIGNMIRTANLTGVSKFFVFGNRLYDKRSAMCSYSHTKIIRIADKELKERLDEEDYNFDENLFYNTFIENNMYPIFIEQHKDGIFIEDINWNEILHGTPCFVFGNEKLGIPENLLKIKDKFTNSKIIQVRQVGNVNSYNVSNMYAIIMHNIFERNLKKVKDQYCLS